MSRFIFRSSQMSLPITLRTLNSRAARRKLTPVRRSVPGVSSACSKNKHYACYKLNCTCDGCSHGFRYKF